MDIDDREGVSVASDNLSKFAYALGQIVSVCGFLVPLVQAIENDFKEKDDEIAALKKRLEALESRGTVH